MWFFKELKEIEILFHSVDVALPNIVFRPNGRHPEFVLHIHLHSLYPFELPNISFDGISQSEAVNLFSALIQVVQLRRPMLKKLMTAASQWSPSRPDSRANEGKIRTVEDVSARANEGKMRTAGDVISRLQWDDNMNRASFCVLYLDRFEGLKSIPFNDVDWTDPPFPEHRIQAFIFEDVVVWDKRIGLDHVFGSRGSGIKFEELMERFKEAKRCKMEAEILLQISECASHTVFIPLDSHLSQKAALDLATRGFANAKFAKSMLFLFAVNAESDEDIVQLIENRKREFNEIKLSVLECSFVKLIGQQFALYRACIDESLMSFITILESDLAPLEVSLVNPESFPSLLIPIESSDRPETSQEESKTANGMELQIISCFSGKVKIFSNLQEPSSLDHGLEFIGVYLTAKYRTQLLRKITPVHQNISGVVCICEMKPKLFSVLHEFPPLGTCIKMTTTEALLTPQIQIVQVLFTSRHRRLVQCNSKAYIIISHIDGVHIRDIPSLLNKQGHQQRLRIELEGVLGVHVGIKGVSNGRDIINRDLLTNPIITEDSGEVQLVLDPCTEITELHIFDFDGTLVASPDEFEGRQEYFNQTQSEFPFIGYYGRKESLMLPIHILPGPAMQDYFIHQKRPEVKTVVLTGRIFKVQDSVQSILDVYGVDAELICKHSGKESKEFKISVLLELLHQYPLVRRVKIWEDNLENLVEFYTLQKQLQDSVQIEILESPVLLTPYHSLQDRFSWTDRNSLCGIGAFLESIGRLKDRYYNARVETGLKFLTGVLKEALDSKFWFLIRGYPIGIKGEVEICFLVSQLLTNDQCLDLIRSRLHQEGVPDQFIEEDSQWSEKRVRIRLHYQEAGPVNFLLALCRVDPEFSNQEFHSAVELMPYVLQSDKLSLSLVENWKWTDSVVESCSRIQLEHLVVIFELMSVIFKQNEMEVELDGLVDLIWKFQRNEWSSDWSSDQSCLAFIQWFSIVDHDLEVKLNGASGSSNEALLNLKKQLGSLIQQLNDKYHWVSVYDLLLQNHAQ